MAVQRQKNSDSKLVVCLLAGLILVAGCSFKKDSGDKEDDQKNLQTRQVKALSVEIFEAEAFHKFNSKLSWQTDEFCIPNIKRINMKSGLDGGVFISDQDKMNRAVVDFNLNEDTEYQYIFRCLNDSRDIFDVVNIRTPRDLVVEGVVTLKKLRQIGFLKKNVIEVSRLAILDDSKLEITEGQITLKFNSAAFHSGAKITNFDASAIENRLVSAMNLYGKPGAEIILKGNKATGTLNFDLRGYPGAPGLPGQDRAESELPELAANGESAQFEISGAPEDLVVNCVPRDSRREPRDRSSVGDKTFGRPNYNGCTVLGIKCIKDATSGASIKGLQGGSGLRGQAGGHSGQVTLQILDTKSLVIQASATPGEGGPQGPGGRGGPSGGRIGLAGSTSFFPAVRQHMGWGIDVSDDEIKRRIHGKFIDDGGCALKPRNGEDIGRGDYGVSQDPSMQGPTGAVMDLLIWDQSIQTYRTLRPQ
ncbi:MAG: hypothetical protein ACK5UJ_03475 [Pseudobdellovibrionaceae bacterium]